jgi:homoserine acetyltransferase
VIGGRPDDRQRWQAESLQICARLDLGDKYPDFMDALVPMPSQPTEMSSRNWMMRRLIIDSIRNDPDWNNGNYNRPTKFGAGRNYSTVSPLRAARWHSRR